MPKAKTKSKPSSRKIQAKRSALASQVLRIIVISLLLILAINFFAKPKTIAKTADIEVKSVGSQITADGKIVSQNEARLNFQTPGKLVSLPFKEGDSVTQGQTIAQLDNYALQRQLSAALNTYRSTRDTFDQTQDNTSTGVLQGQQKYALEVPNRVSIGGQPEVNIINDMVKRIVDQNQANLDNSVVQVELANYAIQLSSLTSPINGIIVHEDVTVPNINITPATTFIIEDPSATVFRAQVKEQDIDFISQGSEATIQMNGNSQTISGTVISIHPQKIARPDGQNVYEVDVASDSLKTGFAYNQSGFIQIKSNITQTTRLVPTWTILNNQHIWVQEGNKNVLKQIEVGKTHGNYTEVLSGLQDEDKVVIDPKSNLKSGYKIL